MGGSPLTILENGILQSLRGKRALTTSQLAIRVKHKNHARIYRLCRHLEKDGKLKSGLKPDKRLLYCLDHEAVVTSDIYPECEAKKHELRTFSGVSRFWSLD